MDEIVHPRYEEMTVVKLSDVSGLDFVARSSRSLARPLLTPIPPPPFARTDERPQGQCHRTRLWRRRRKGRSDWTSARAEDPRVRRRRRERQDGRDERLEREKKTSIWIWRGLEYSQIVVGEGDVNSVVDSLVSFLSSKVESRAIGELGYTIST